MRLVVAGGSPVIQDSDVQEIQTLAKGIEVVTVAGAGHMIPWDDLEGFLQAVAGFQPYAQGGVPDGSRKLCGDLPSSIEDVRCSR